MPPMDLTAVIGVDAVGPYYYFVKRSSSEVKSSLIRDTNLQHAISQ